MKTSVAILIALFISLIAYQHAAHAVGNPNDGLTSDSSARFRDVTVSAYSPGCSRDAGKDETSDGVIKPSQAFLDKHNIVVAAVALDVPHGMCLRYVGGTPDMCSGGKKSQKKQQCQATYNRMKDVEYIVVDKCPGCKKTRQFPNGKVDLPMTCSIARDFRVQHASFNVKPCSQTAEAIINKRQGTRTANSSPSRISAGATVTP